uniref:ATP synthase F1 subunit epsilon n=2 Tax=Arion vulgaris TaxID=1028688 RepID=A0A0B7BGL8_9EUPU
MAARLIVSPRLRTPRFLCLVVRAMSGGQLGDGAGKGGGGGGSIRTAGGSFAQMEVAKEEQYFRNLQKLQFDKLKEMLEDEVSHHELLINQHLMAIDHHKKKIDLLHKKSKDRILSA